MNRHKALTPPKHANNSGWFILFAFMVFLCCTGTDGTRRYGKTLQIAFQPDQCRGWSEEHGE